MTRWLRLLGALLAVGLLLGACGGDDGSSDDGAGGGGDSGSNDDAANDYGGGGDTGSDDDAACDGDVCLSGTQFAPDALTVAVGDTVTWASVDSPDHTVTADDDSFDSGTLSNGDSFEQTFDTAGEFTYHCEIHSSMTGTVTVQ